MGLGQPRRVHGEQNVRRAVGAFVADAFERLVFLPFDAVDADAGLFGEVGVKALRRSGNGGRVKVEHLLVGLSASCQARAAASSVDLQFIGRTPEKMHIQN